MANAGIDQSNVAGPGEWRIRTAASEDPDASAAGLRERLRALTGCAPGVVISRQFRSSVAYRNDSELQWIAPGVRQLLTFVAGTTVRSSSARTVVGHADEAASAASIVMGQARKPGP